MCALKRGSVVPRLTAPPHFRQSQLRTASAPRYDTGRIGAACPASVEQATILPHVVAQATLWCSPMRPRRYSMAHLPEPIACRAWDASCLMAWFILRSGSDEVQHQADDKNDACGIGSRRHVTPAGSAAGRSGALYSALFVFKCLAVSRRSAALHPAMG
jgi:hypothetical protein